LSLLQRNHDERVLRPFRVRAALKENRWKTPSSAVRRPAGRRAIEPRTRRHRVPATCLPALAASQACRNRASAGGASAGAAARCLLAIRTALPIHCPRRQRRLRGLLLTLA